MFNYDNFLQRKYKFSEEACSHNILFTFAIETTTVKIFNVDKFKIYRNRNFQRSHSSNSKINCIFKYVHLNRVLCKFMSRSLSRKSSDQ